MRRTFQLLFGTLFLILLGSAEAKALLSQNHAGDEWRSTPKYRVMGYAENAPGRFVFCPQLKLRLAMGCEGYGYENASGQGNYANGDPVNGLDPDGRFGKGAIDGMEGNIAAGDPNSSAFNAGFDVGNFFGSVSAGSQTLGNEITAPVNPLTYINAAENFSGAVGNAQPFFAQADGGSGLESYSSAIAYTALYDAPIAGPIFKGLDSTYYDPYGNSLVTQTTTQQGLNIALGLSEYATFALAPGAGATAAEGGGDAFASYMNQVQTLDVSTAENGAVFYSGPGNRALAEQFAAANERTTLEMTPGGQWLDQQQLFGPNSPLTPDQAVQVWSQLSQRFASGASGNAIGFVNGARAGSIFNTVEYPTLLENPNVTNVLTGGH